jgi:catechol 2,3-dioxygenase-like lactoylglutathione lyase family enzyme
MDWTLEVVQVPVTDVDRAVAFYRDRLGFALDHDTTVAEGTRFAQLTRPGSGCSIVVSTGLVDMPAGSQRGLQLVVADLWTAHAQLVASGVENSGVTVYGREGIRPATDEYEQSYIRRTFRHFLSDARSTL